MNDYVKSKPSRFLKPGRFWGLWGPHKFLGLWWSVKLDETVLHHAGFAILFCLLHPIIPIVFYLSKELREGTGYEENGVERCVGFGKCLQGFGLDDFAVVLAVAVPWWIWLSNFSLFNFTFSLFNFLEILSCLRNLFFYF